MAVINKIIILLLIFGFNSICFANENNNVDIKILKNNGQDPVTSISPQQLDELHSLFIKAIGTQNPEVQYRLGRMYQSGNGVVKDDVQAYVWTALSLTNGYPGATKTLRDLEANMSSYEVNYAIDLLRKIRELR